MAGTIDIQINYEPRTVLGATCLLLPDPRQLPLGTRWVDEETGQSRYVVRTPVTLVHRWMPACLR